MCRLIPSTIKIIDSWIISPGFVAFCRVGRGQWKLQLLPNVSVIVLGPVSGSFSWQSQMVLPNYRATAPSNTCCCLPPCHYCRQQNNITLSHEGKNWRKRGLTHYPPSLRCTPTSVWEALFGGLGQFVIYFCIAVMSIVSAENVKGFSKKPRHFSQLFSQITIKLILFYRKIHKKYVGDEWVWWN